LTEVTGSRRWAAFIEHPFAAGLIEHGCDAAGLIGHGCEVI